MTTKNAMVMLFSFSLLATSTMMVGAQQTASINSSQNNMFLSDSNSVEIAERGSGRIEPSATSSVLERHSFS